MPEMTKQRPKYLALHEIRLPLAGYASILHRVSGAGLFLMLPLLIWLLQLSLGSTAESAEMFAAVTGNLLVMAKLYRPFTDKPLVILPSKKRGAVHDLLLITRKGQFQRESDR